MTSVSVHNIEKINVVKKQHGGFYTISLKAYDKDGNLHETSYYVNDDVDLEINNDEGVLDDNSKK